MKNVSGIKKEEVREGQELFPTNKDEKSTSVEIYRVTKRRFLLEQGFFTSYP